MRWAALVVLLVVSGTRAWGATAAELATEMRLAGLDSAECYRIRDLSFAKQDVRLYFTDGYLIFGKAVAGRRRAAVFLGDVEAGDAEVLVFPPTRSERMSLVRAIDSPNLNEHFKLAVMVFSDDTFEVLLKAIEQTGEPQKSPEMGTLAEQDWNDVVRNLTASFLVRLVEDSVSQTGASRGMFFAALRGERLGNFDVLFDPLRSEQVTLGRVSDRAGASYFDTWTSFQARSFRNKAVSTAGARYKLADYRIEAGLAADLTLSVKTKVTLTPAEDGLRTLEFSLSPRMRLTRATLDGAPAEFFQRESLRASLLRDGDASILLIPAAPLERGKAYVAEFEADGIVIQSAGNSVYYVGARENWYPNSPGQFATYDVSFRYPKDLDLVLPGQVVAEATDGESNYAHRRISTPVRFLGFNLGDYERVEVSRGPYKIDVYANKRVEPGLAAAARPSYSLVPRMIYDPAQRRVAVNQFPSMMIAVPSPPTPQLQQLATEIAAAFEFMAGKFGPPPLGELTVSPIPGGFGQGFPGLLYISTMSYLRPEQRPASVSGEFQQAFYSDILHAHEVAHQWWGNAVSTSEARDAWLMEALANYSALLYLEKRRGTRALDYILGEYRKRLLAQTAEGRTKESVGPLVWGNRLLSSEAPDALAAIVYEKGAWILHMLRRRLGDDRFMSMLAELAKRYNRSVLTTEEFRLHVAKFLPPGAPDPTLETFFQNFVYSTGIPTVQIQSSVKGKAPSYTVSGTLTQSGVDEEFTAWVPVEIQFRTGKPVIQWVKTDSEPVRFSARLKQAPLRVALDPSDSILAVKK